MLPHVDQSIEKRFVLSLALTALVLVAEVIGGLWAGSLALLSDAAHLFYGHLCARPEFHRSAPLDSAAR
jgi:Co/Zn/Cd efflux system component